MRNKHTSHSRRRFVAVGLAGAATMPVAFTARLGVAAELPQLDEGDPAAKALAYVHDASGVDEATRGGAGHVCAACRFYTQAQAEWGPCALFPGKAVAATGWCKGWVARQ